jgi:hypothetical protein
MPGKIIHSVVILASLSIRFCFSQYPVINEVMYSNHSCIADKFGDYSDWAEIYNPGSQAINLEGWKLTDDINRSEYWQFPAYVLGAHQFLIVFLSGRNSNDGGELHTNFRLQLMEEELILIDPGGTSRYGYPAQCVPPDLSIGMKPDASGNIVLLNPSPGFSNNNSDTVQINFQQDTISFSHAGGFYAEAIQLNLRNGYPGNSIHYTLDGSIPDDRSPGYDHPLFLEDWSDRENRISGIRTSERWIKPGNDIFKSPVVRAVVYSEGCPASPVFSKTYFINENIQNRYQVPVVSLITDPENLFDEESGIYVKGNHNNFNLRGKEWERPAHIEYFGYDGELLLRQDIGIRIHGGGTRIDPQKSLRLYAREEYGAERFRYPFFDQKQDLDSFKTLILSSVKYWSGTLFKDELCHRLVQDLDIDYMAGQTVIVFINGEYWGIQSLRERQDEYYIQSNHRIMDSDFDIIEYNIHLGRIVEQGDDIEYQRLLSFLESSDMSATETYLELGELIDAQNFIDYLIAELYLANSDFPSNNVKLWRPREVEGKWRLFFFDCDNCMIRTYYDHISEYTNTSEHYRAHESWTTFIFQKLLENPDFRDAFYYQFCKHLNSTFQPETVIRMIDQYLDIYRPLIQEHIYRWHYPNSVIKWKGNTDMLKGFAVQRPSHMLLQLVKNLGNPLIIYPNPSDGNFRIQQLLGDSDGIQLEITAVSGARLHTESIRSGSTEDIHVETYLPEGVYILSVRNEHMVFSEKLFIQH